MSPLPRPQLPHPPTRSIHALRLARSDLVRTIDILECHRHRASSSLPGRKPKRDPISNIDDVIDWFDSSSDLDDVKNSMNLMRKAYEGGKEEEFEEWKSAR